MNKAKLLILDDEQSILNSLKRLFIREKYDVTVTPSWSEALELIKSNSYALVISDQRMPEMQGSEFLGKVKEAQPHCTRILLTGYSDIEAALEAINQGEVYRYILKPWDETELLKTVKDGTERSLLIQENEKLNEKLKKQNSELIDLNQTLEVKVEERTKEISSLNKKLKSSFLGTVKSMGKLSEMHSSTVGSHSKRVAKICKDIARGLGLTGRMLLAIEIAAFLHDIGKVGVSERTLKTPETSLSLEDHENLKRHALIGESIVKSIPHLEEVAHIIRHHHEKYDGTGYPDQLSGDKIPIGSRIIHVADAFDKILNSKANLNKINIEDAFNKIKHHTYSHFDPIVIQQLNNLMMQGKIQADYAIEFEISPQELKPGMLLARDIKTSKGLRLIQKNTLIEPKHISRITQFHSSDPIIDGIYIFKKTPPRTKAG